MVLATSPKAISEVLVHNSYDFDKIPQMKVAIERFTGDGIASAIGDDHKVC